MFAKTLVIAAAFAAVASAAECDPLEIGKFVPIAGEPILNLCKEDSGFTLVPPSGLPDDAQYKKMCVSDNCKKVIDLVKSKGPSDCDLNVGIIINVGKLVNEFPAQCARVLGGSTPATTAPGPAPVTPGATPSASQNNGQTGQKTPAPAPVDNSC